MKIFMALESIRKGARYDEWHTVATASSDMPADRLDAVRRSLDDCVASMVHATLPEDYTDPLSDVRALQSEGYVNILDAGFAYGAGLDALYGALGTDAGTVFGDAAARCTDPRRTRVVAAVYRET